MTLFDVIVSLISLSMICTGALSAYVSTLATSQRLDESIDAMDCASNAAEYRTASQSDQVMSANGCQVQVIAKAGGWVEIEAKVGQAKQDLWLEPSSSR